MPIFVLAMTLCNASGCWYDEAKVSAPNIFTCVLAAPTIAQEYAFKKYGGDVTVGRASCANGEKA